MLYIILSIALIHSDTEAGQEATKAAVKQLEIDKMAYTWLDKNLPIDRTKYEKIYLIGSAIANNRISYTWTF